MCSVHKALFHAFNAPQHSLKFLTSRASVRFAGGRGVAKVVWNIFSGGWPHRRSQFQFRIWRSVTEKVTELSSPRVDKKRVFCGVAPSALDYGHAHRVGDLTPLVIPPGSTPGTHAKPLKNAPKTRNEGLISRDIFYFRSVCARNTTQTCDL